MSLNLEGFDIHQPTPSLYLERVLTAPALQFIKALHQNFNPRRLELLAKRQERQKALNAGGTLDFLPETEAIRKAEWKVAETPKDLLDRRVEITGPTDAKMLINALNSGARIFMADMEDSLSPTWANVIQGQINLQDANRHTLNFKNDDGRTYHLKPAQELATLLVRPRGWHLSEKNLTLGGEALSGSLFDFGLYFFHNAHERLKQGTAPYFYLPKMESHLEARLWNDVFNFSQDYLSIPRGTIRATCLIETILAAFEMEEFLYELKDHSAGLNAGRWDYIFSMIKRFANHSDKVLPDRAQVTMAVPFMRAYSELLVKTCHKRGAHAIGGMAAFIPSRKDPEVNEQAIRKVTEDKTREVQIGFDGTWVAHPDLVPVAMKVFDAALKDTPNQKHKQLDHITVNASRLLDVSIAGSSITEDGVRHNIRIAIQYIGAWLSGLGAVALYNLMEDAATAEISRAQLWQWIKHGSKLADGRTVTRAMYESYRDQELEALGGPTRGRNQEAVKLLDQMVLSQEFSEFLTLPAYVLLKKVDGVFPRKNFIGMLRRAR